MFPMIPAMATESMLPIMRPLDTNHENTITYVLRILAFPLNARVLTGAERS